MLRNILVWLDLLESQSSRRKDQQWVSMRREQMERFLASNSTVSEWCAFSKVSDFTLCKWMAYFRVAE